jgi:hypothetical protein
VLVNGVHVGLVVRQSVLGGAHGVRKAKFVVEGRYSRVHIAFVVSGSVVCFSVGHVGVMDIGVMDVSVVNDWGGVVSSKDVFVVGSIFGSVMISSVDNVSEIVTVMFSSNVSFARMVELVLVGRVVAPLFMMRSFVQVVGVELVVTFLLEVVRSLVVRFVMSGSFIVMSLLEMVRSLVVVRHSLKGVIRNVLISMVCIHFLVMRCVVVAIIGVMVKLMGMFVSVGMINHSMVHINCVMIVGLEVLSLADNVVGVGVRHMRSLNVDMFVVGVRVLLHLVVGVVVDRVVAMLANVVCRVLRIVVAFKFLTIVRVRVNVNMVIVFVMCHIFVVCICVVLIHVMLVIVV